MRKRRVLLTFACVLCVVLGIWKGMQEAARTVDIEGEPVSYICQDGKIYLYLKDLLRFGFFVDTAESQMIETRSGVIAGVVLWKEDIYPGKPQIMESLPDAAQRQKYEIYINGLEISAYAQGKELMISAEELIGQPVKLKQDSDISEETVLYDKNGNKNVLPEKVIQISKNSRNTIHGYPEAPNHFSFESCSQYLIQAETNTLHKLSINMMQKGDILQTKNGSFPLEEVRAGECAGVSILTIMEEYTELSDVLHELDISYALHNGKLELKGKGNGKTMKRESTDAIGTLPQYPFRMFAMKLELSTGEKLDCLYDGKALFAAKDDVAATAVWECHGYDYKNGEWIPRVREYMKY